MNISTVNELIASLESAGELSIREQKFLKLAKAFKQLAAENFTMNRLLTDISDNHVEYFSEGEGTMFAGVPLDYVSEINMYVSRDVNAENPFPATDAYLAGIKADAIDEAAVELDRVDTVASTRVIGFKLREFSQQLREGAK
ncbi:MULTISPECIES: hypothetical protein [Klebsiella]|uniref:Uncharacterized protein n=1 Tax=Klebsiella pneumoniae TaxID=573 RepID=A0A486TSC4_KLEPN|nr:MULTISPECIES: hypothetical protein [Klebsiella]HBR1460106.1 hypothetical protein [Klebsiella quasipneumoniae subsp. quasipneumoniae]APB53009.1 hypothetical protein AGE75_24440 [Klebsiella pneumoniae]ARZ95313.1 hypothetical protein AM373_22195 [Klebsiella pneumoniae]EIV7191131.1 hypothetical protein [Klebsiella pneumoniae]EIW0147386.1 hypothetical protein [Klebsiella pneumoniae]